MKNLHLALPLVSLLLSLAGCGSDPATEVPDASAPGDDAGVSDAMAPPTCPPLPAGISAGGQDAYAAVNTARVSAGSPCATVVATLDLSAEKHCAYYAANTMNAMCIANPHVEVAGCTAFFAANFDEREKLAGYSGNPDSENMHFIGNAKGAIQGWLDTIYHRYPIVDPWSRDFGYGNAAGCDTMDFASGASTPDTTVAVYPYDGQTGVGTQFDGGETPAPPTPPGGWPSGYPITIFAKGKLTITTLTEDGAPTALPILTVDKLSWQPNGTAFYTEIPLKPNTRYHVHAEGDNGAPFKVDTSFTTGG